MEPSCFVTASSWGVAQGLIVSIGRAFRARGQAVYAYLCPRVCLWILSSLGDNDEDEKEAEMQIICFSYLGWRQRRGRK